MLSNLSWTDRVAILVAWCVVGICAVLCLTWWMHLYTVLLIGVLAAAATFLLIYNANGGDLAATEAEIGVTLTGMEGTAKADLAALSAAVQVEVAKAQAAAKAEWQKAIALAASVNQSPPSLVFQAPPAAPAAPASAPVAPATVATNA